MRAASKAHPSLIPASTPAPSAHEAASPLAVAVLATLLLLALWRPAIVHAQPMSAAKAAASNAAHGAPASVKNDDAAAPALSTAKPHEAPAAAASPAVAATSRDAQPATDTTSAAHVVRAGETLWQLAERYYGDGHQWQELAKRNALVTTNGGKLLLVGMKLRVPAKAPPREKRVAATKDADIPVVARTPAVPPVGANQPSAVASHIATGKATLAAQTAGKSDDAPAAPRTTGVKRDVKRNATATVSPTRPAEKARLMAADSTASALVTPTASTTASSSTTADVGPARRTMLGANSAPDISDKEGQLAASPTHMLLVGRDALRDARKASEAPTVFIRVVPDAAELDAQTREMTITDAPRPRRAEYEGAPFTIDDAALRKAGQLTRRVGAVAGSSAADPDRLFIADALELTAPSGVTLAPGDRLLSVHLAEGLTKGGHIAVPTGIVRVTRVENGKPVLGTVQSQAGSIEQGQPLLLVRGTAADPSVRASTIALNDIETTVRWIDGTESLPTIQSYVLLGAGSAQGVKVGDEFELHTARLLVKGNPAPSNGEDRIARARIVRIGDRESTAIIVRHERAGIAVGVPARRVARVP